MKKRQAPTDYVQAQIPPDALDPLPLRRNADFRLFLIWCFPAAFNFALVTVACLHQFAGESVLTSRWLFSPFIISYILAQLVGISLTRLTVSRASRVGYVAAAIACIAMTVRLSGLASDGVTQWRPVTQSLIGLVVGFSLGIALASKSRDWPDIIPGEQLMRAHAILSSIFGVFIGGTIVIVVFAGRVGLAYLLGASTMLCLMIAGGLQTLHADRKEHLPKTSKSGRKNLGSQSLNRRPAAEITFLGLGGLVAFSLLVAVAGELAPNGSLAQGVTPLRALMALAAGIVLASGGHIVLGRSLKPEMAVGYILQLAGALGLFAAVALISRDSEGIRMAFFVSMGVVVTSFSICVDSLLMRLASPRRHTLAMPQSLVYFVVLMFGIATAAKGPSTTWKGAIAIVCSVSLIAMGLFATIRRVRRSRFSPRLTFWRNLNKFLSILLTRVRRVGICTIPVEGPVIVAANHNSTLDPFVLTAGSPNRSIGFMIAQEYNNIPIFRRLTSAIECVPVTRSGVDTASIKATLRYLAAGKCLGLFLQGRVQHPAEPIEIQEGIAMLALRSGATVVPACIWGLKWSGHTLGPLFKMHRARVHYGKPVDLTPWKGRERDKAAYREIAEHIMDRILALRPDNQDAEERN